MRAKYCFSFLFLLLSSAAFTQTFTDPAFIAETAVVTGESPMGVTWSSDGRMFVWRKPGTVVVFSADLKSSKIFLDISSRVNKTTDRGLVGFALDPDFATNGLFYVGYVYEPNGNANDTSPKTQRVSRFHASATDPTIGDPASETVILGTVSTAGCSGINQDCMPNDFGQHSVDDLHFYGGKLYVSVGDGDADAFTDRAFRAQNLDSLNGKILRVNTDGTGPSDNPFYNGDPHANRSKVFSYGLRNPFRFSIDAATGDLYIGDVGQHSWEEIDRGRGKNFGWPCYEGNGVEADFAGNAICQNLPSSAVTFPIKAIPHSEGSCVIGGPLYSGSTYPATYRGSVFYTDFVGEYIKRLTLDASGNVTGTSTFATGVSGPVYIAQGPDGNLYYVGIGAQVVKRIRYTGTANRPPIAAASANPSNGYAPLNVQFSSAGTSDPDGDSLTYTWDFGDGTTAASANPLHQYAANGKYNAVLTVKDPSDATATASIAITVGSTPPVATITAPQDGLKANIFDVINFSGSAWDPDDGNLPNSSLHWSVILHHNTHTHDVLEASGTGGSFTVEPHDTAATFYYEVKLTATDSSGLTGAKSVFVYPIITTCATPTTSTAVVICAPPNGTSVSASFAVSAAGGSAVTFMEIWLDSTKIWQNSGNQTQTTLSTANNVSAGPHTITVFGRNSTGVVGSAKSTVTVGGSGGGSSGGGGTCSAGTSTIVICAPTNSASTTSPVQVTAAGSSAVTWMEVWFNSTKVWQGSGNSMNQSIPAAAGTYTLTIYGRNSTGVLGSASRPFTVTNGGGGGGGTTTCTAPPSPPPTAGVNVCSPTSTTAPGSTMTSPVRALAAGTVSGTFARMELWIDGVKKTTSITPKIDYQATLASGSHRFTFFAVNTAGTVWSAVRYATVP